MWFREHLPMTLACVYVVTLGVVAALVQHSMAPGTMLHTRIADTTLVYALGGLLWPFCWSVVCGASMEHMPSVGYLGLVWPSILLLLDAAFAHHATDQDPHKQAMGMQVDGNTLSGLALTLGGVLVQSVSSNFATAAAPMMSATVLLTLLFILPTPNLHSKSRHANLQRSVSKVVLQWCLGFVITAVAIAFGVGMLRAPQQGSELKKAVATAAPK